jgi:hypothetical protein
MENPTVFKRQLLWLSDDFICEELQPNQIDGWMDAISSCNTQDNSPESNALRIQEANDYLDSVRAGFRMIGSKCDEQGALTWVLAPVVFA